MSVSVLWIYGCGPDSNVHSLSLTGANNRIVGISIDSVMNGTMDGTFLNVLTSFHWPCGCFFFGFNGNRFEWELLFGEGNIVNRTMLVDGIGCLMGFGGKLSNRPMHSCPTRRKWSFAAMQSSALIIDRMMLINMKHSLSWWHRIGRHKRSTRFGGMCAKQFAHF